MRLTRMIPGAGGCSAGQWLVPGLGLLLHRSEGGWQLTPTVWVGTQRLAHLGNVPGWHQQRAVWLARHGLDQACFARRRDAAQALEYSLQRDPLPVAEGVYLCD